MIHAGAFKQVEVRLESRDGFPGGLEGEGLEMRRMGGGWVLPVRVGAG